MKVGAAENPPEGAAGRAARCWRGCAATLLSQAVLVSVCGSAHAAEWRLAGPDHPIAGESATYRLTGPPGIGSAPYEVVVVAGARACPGGPPAGETAQTSSVDGYLSSDRSAAIQPLSFGRGRWTVCVYDHRAVVVARKVVRTIRGRDRLGVSAVRERGFETDNVLVTATGYVGRTGDITVPPGPEQHVGEVIATVQPSGRRCPQRASDPQGPKAASSRIYDQARFKVQMTVYDAFERTSRPVMCAYLAAPRRVFADVLPRTVAHASVPVSADAAPSPPGSQPNADQLVGAAVFLVLAIAVCLGVTTAVRAIRKPAPSRSPSIQSSEAPRRESARTAVPVGAPPAPAPGAVGPQPQPATSDADAAAPYSDAERRRRRALVPYIIQAALQATADVYRDRLHAILEHQDGLDWLDAFNERRRRNMLNAGRREPEPYRSFEARAVIGCLAYDAAGLQLVPAHVAAKARQLSGLAIAAHHPDPDDPLTELDAVRAWQLFNEITGARAPGDPFDLPG